MKDKKTLFAFLFLILLVGILISLTLSKRMEDTKRDNKINSLSGLVESLSDSVSKIKEIRGLDGKTPIKGIDYFDGDKGDTGNSAVSIPGTKGEKGESTYEIAVKNGFEGTENEWLETQKVKGDPAAELDIDCVTNRLMKKYSNDDFWQPTNIRCEVIDE